MKKYKVMRITSIGIFGLFIVNLIINMISCMYLDYPHEALGVTVWNWTEQFSINFLFLLIYWSIPLVTAAILFVISILKLNKSKENFDGKY